eukprot:711956-Pelagomonas_calceolata.AAC.1
MDAVYGRRGGPGWEKAVASRRPQRLLKLYGIHVYNTLFGWMQCMAGATDPVGGRPLRAEGRTG